MSRQRMINTRFWDDDYTSNLDPIEKLMFLYFLSNTSTNICGIYEIPLKKVAMDTGIDKEMVNKIVDRFTRDGKIFYHNGWVCLKNFIKNQNQRSPQVLTGIQREMEEVPQEIMDIFIGYGYPMDTLLHLTKPNLTKPNLSDADNEKEFNLEEKLQKMEKIPNSYLDIIASFIREKPVKVENSKQLSIVISRFARVSQKLSGAYTNEQIFGAAEKIKKENKRRENRGDDVDWTLETILKTLTK